jgi:molybdopterin molybdotransferase
VPGPERVALDEALGRVTAGDVRSPYDLPLFRNSQMDGIAVLASDVAAAPVRLALLGSVPAGAAAPAVVAAGTAVRIMTGAVLPEGADAVVPVEDITVADGQVLVQRARRPGEYVRERGSDVRAGETIVAGGVRLAPRHLAVLAAAGIPSIDVRRRVRVAVITSGTELIEPGSTPSLGEVFDSNQVALAAALREVGAEVVLRSRVRDDAEAMRATLTASAAVADLILTSGGISKGDYEVVRETLEPLGGQVGSVAMQPGGPQATAVYEGTPVVCFPGNPVSTQVSFEVFVAPLLRRRAGLPDRRATTGTLADAVRSVEGKRQFLRGRKVGDRVELVSGPGSHLVAGLAAADVLVVIPEDVTELHPGDAVETWAL